MLTSEQTAIQQRPGRRGEETGSSQMALCRQPFYHFCFSSPLELLYCSNDTVSVVTPENDSTMVMHKKRSTAVVREKSDYIAQDDLNIQSCTEDC